MDSELKQLLEENLRVSKETNALLRLMNRQAWWGFAGKIVFWALLIILPLFFIKALLAPYLELLQGTQSGAGTFDMSQFEELIRQYRDIQ